MATGRPSAASFEAARRTHSAHLDALDALERVFDAEMAQLASDRQALEDDRADLIRETDEKLAREEELQERMRAAAPPPDELVKLNVGGARFETSRAVLTKVEDSMLGRMFGRCDAMLQANPLDGSIFIDRDGERFRVILDFLRDLDDSHTQWAIRALAEPAQESMMKELDYFGLEAAVFSGRPWTDDAAFRPGPWMREDRAWCAAVLAGGRVIVFGGGPGDDTTEVLDTQTMAFTAGPDMLSGRMGCAAVQIDADRVLVVSGTDDNHGYLDTTEIFHLSTQTFTPGPDMLTARNVCAAVALDAHRILIAGGDTGNSFLSSSEILSLDTMTIAPGPAMSTSRGGCAAVALDEHRILVAGGESDSGLLNTTEILDIRTMAFAAGPSMGSARDGCMAVPVDAQHVLIIGGRDLSGASLASTELLDVEALKFAPGPAMQAGRYLCAATRLDTAEEERPRILVMGGEDDDKTDLSTTEVLIVDHQRSVRAARRHGNVAS